MPESEAGRDPKHGMRRFIIARQTVMLKRMITAPTVDKMPAIPPGPVKE